MQEHLGTLPSSGEMILLCWISGKFMRGEVDMSNVKFLAVLFGLAFFIFVILPAMTLG